MITIEYLLPFNTIDGICKDIISFKSLLNTNSYFSLSQDKITYKGSKYNFKVTLSVVPQKECSVFHITFETSRLTEKFREMLNTFRKTVGIYLKDNIQVIWDGISFEWSKELYPKIYETENCLRKLISKFMLTKLGIGWHDSHIPKDVRESIKEKNYTISHRILYDVDFIQLANFLFKPYSNKDTAKLPDILNKVIENGITEDQKKDIMEYLPKSNWDRYFSKLVDCESEQLKKNWDILYEVRCKVAHNKPMLFEDYEKAKKLCDSLGLMFEKAQNNLDKIQIPENEKENIGLQTIGTVNETTKSFADNYFAFSDTLSTFFRPKEERSLLASSYKNPIENILASSVAGHIKLTDHTASSLFAINNYKDDLLSSFPIITNHKPFFDENIFRSTKANLLETDFSTYHPLYKSILNTENKDEFVVKGMTENLTTPLFDKKNK